MGKDLGTYHVIVEIPQGSFIYRWQTGGRFIPGGTETITPWPESEYGKTTWSAPIWENEEELIAGILFQFLDGNYSCACNLLAFIDQAQQKHFEENYDDAPKVCGDIDTIKLTLVRPDGKMRVIYPE
jgi:hypothetical protein